MPVSLSSSFAVASSPLEEQEAISPAASSVALPPRGRRRGRGRRPSRGGARRRASGWLLPGLGPHVRGPWLACPSCRLCACRACHPCACSLYASSSACARRTRRRGAPGNGAHPAQREPGGHAAHGAQRGLRDQDTDEDQHDQRAQPRATWCLEWVTEPAHGRLLPSSTVRWLAPAGARSGGRTVDMTRRANSPRYGGRQCTRCWLASVMVAPSVGLERGDAPHAGPDGNPSRWRLQVVCHNDGEHEAEMRRRAPWAGAGCYGSGKWSLHHDAEPLDDPDCPGHW